MSTWFEKNTKLFSGDPLETLHHWLHKAQLHLALNGMAGPTGVSRFLLYYRIDRGAVTIEKIDSIPLPKGGGLPQNTSDDVMNNIKMSILQLQSLMSKFSFSKGCLGFVRDFRNEYELLCFFDDDIEGISLENLPIPEYSYPLEEPVYLKLLGSAEYQLGQVVMESSRVVSNWEEWSIEEDTLILCFPDGRKTRYHITVLGTFNWSTFLWKWEVKEPLFPEDAFSCPEFLATWDQAMELGYLSTVRLNASWLFIGRLDNAMVLLCSVYS